MRWYRAWTSRLSYRRYTLAADSRDLLLAASTESKPQISSLEGQFVQPGCFQVCCALRAHEQHALAILGRIVRAASLVFHDESRFTSLTATPNSHSTRKPPAQVRTQEASLRQYQKDYRENLINLSLCPKSPRTRPRWPWPSSTLTETSLPSSPNRP